MYIISEYSYNHNIKFAMSFIFYPHTCVIYFIAGNISCSSSGIGEVVITCEDILLVSLQCSFSGGPLHHCEIFMFNFSCACKRRGNV